MSCEEGWVTTESGLRYFDHVVGEGTEVKDGMSIEVHYTGWLFVDGKRGKQFDSSVERGPFAFQLGVTPLIAGWTEGMVGMRVGGKREMIIPPEIGYGDRGAGGVIPPGATLDFEVEVLSAK